MSDFVCPAGSFDTRNATWTPPAQGVVDNQMEGKLDSCCFV